LLQEFGLGVEIGVRFPKLGSGSEIGVRFKLIGN